MIPAGPAATEVGQVTVLTSGPEGHSPEVWAMLATRKIVQVSEDAPAPIRDQANAYRSRIERLLTHYFSEALRCQREGLINAQGK
jgi:hypothetical protein